MDLTTLLIIVTVFASIAIIALTLMQQSKGDMGSAFGGGGSSSMFGSRGSANFLSRSTSVMTTVFFIAALSLAYLYSQRDGGEAVIDPLLQEQSNELPTLDVETDTAAPEAVSNDVPTLEVDDLVDSIPAAEDGVENTVDSVEQAVEEAAEEVTEESTNQ